MDEQSRQLALLSTAKTALAEANTIAEVKTIRDKAEAIRLYAKAQGDCLEIQNYAAEVKIRAERKAGELLAEIPKNGGARDGKRGSIAEPRLAEIGVTKKQSHRWQAVASVPEEKFERHIEQTKKADGELTTASVLTLAKTVRNAARNASHTVGVESVVQLESLISEGKKFGCIYADPPWRYGNQGTRAATDNHYPTMSPEEIAALPIEQLAAENAHLHLWTTNAFLFDCQRIIEAWGFTYKSCFVWVKSQMGIGNYWRVSHEFMLLAVRGDCPFLDRSQMSWMEIPRSSHSAKPDKIREAVEKVSPGPRLELFGRSIVKGWTVWGNQIERTMFQMEPSA
jgi:N6-adenosine-specific RNA methylase IME4